MFDSNRFAVSAVLVEVYTLFSDILVLSLIKTLCQICAVPVETVAVATANA